MGVCHSSLPESTHVQSVNMLQGQEPVTDRDTLLCEFSKIAENGAFLFYKGVDDAVLVKPHISCPHTVQAAMHTV